MTLSSSHQYFQYFDFFSVRMPEMNLRSDKRDDESHLRVLEVDGYYLPPFVKEEHFRSMKTWKARNDDVIISAYPKAGNVKDDIFLKLIFLENTTLCN